MKLPQLVLFMALLTCPSLAPAQGWPEVTPTARPWMRWWWPGSAVEPAQLTRQLEAFAAAGIGGVEITPIYGARGAESRDLPYLSPRWVEMLAHTTREARRLGLGVDMATGTGWPFGGPGVSVADGSSSLQLVAGRLTGKPTAMKVKRAAPGGEGLVLDPYSTDALFRYLQPFTKALAALPRGAVRSQFHDSFEYYDASWSPSLPEAFLRMHGYDIQQYAAEIAGEKPLDADTLGRIKGDYRRTLATLHLAYVESWVRWSRAQGSIARNQAHGSPGRLLDLYGASDIPETESFGATVLPIPGLRQIAGDIREDPDPAINLIGRFASSAAHVNGRQLASSETLTWLRENFHESPSQAKPQLDRLFVAGINHIFYHGSTYSPPEAMWPGWFFYAATQLNPTNPLWRDFTAMHAYVTRVQSVLQAGKPDNDVLFYWPEADEQDDATGLMRQHGMHENEWLVQSPAGKLARRLLEAGYSLDFISDQQLQAVEAEPGAFRAPGGEHYKLIVVPKTVRMPVETLSALLRLQRQHARVLFEALPLDVPGHGRLAQRRGQFARLLASDEARHASIQPELVRTLEQWGATRERAADLGLWFNRRRRVDGHDYFFVNATANRIAGWMQLETSGGAAQWMDPLTGESGRAALRPGRNGAPLVYVLLDSGQSLLLRTVNGKAGPDPGGWRYLEPAGQARELAGGWKLDFRHGGPELPEPVSLEKLASWTSLADADAGRFSGTARYSLRFNAPEERADDWRLDLGDVRETARVTLNGKFLGTVWSLPASIRVGGALEPGTNVLEIEVTNLPANRVRDLDLRKVDWKVMKDINLASLRYRALDASTWAPAPAGLLGPVRLVPLGIVSPRP
jgi:hypothetical protein